MTQFHFNDDGDLLCALDLTGSHVSVHEYLPFNFNENYALLCAEGLASNYITAQGQAVTTDAGDNITTG